jgi:outer membrane protein OmpA-like peptidoglycan-associated protein
LGVTRLGSPFVPDAATKLNIHAGLGIQSFSTEHVVFGVEARAVRIETQTAYTEIMGLATLGFRWGGSARIMPVAAPAPVPVPPILPTPNPAPVTAPNAVAPEAVAPVAKTVPPMVAAPVAKVVPPPPVVKFVLNDAVLHFANGRHILPPQGVKAVQIVAQRLKDYHGGYTLTVTGYTSSIGKPAFNRRLSQLRAEAVAKVLQQTGISAASMQTAGAGPDRPVASNHTRMGQAKNRRVEIAVQAAGATVEKRTVDTDVTE